MMKGRLLGIISKLVKTIKDADVRFDDSSISPMVRQVLLHWGYELVENVVFHIKMSYYQLNRDKLLEKA